jgi:L-threonylcarbamoyladenylate synthase
MSLVFDCSDHSRLLEASREARAAIGRGELIVLPTDTVYGVGAEAFDADAIQRLLDAKGRTRQSPPPVLIAGRAMMSALASEVTEPVGQLADAFWPGPLTLVVMAQASLSWDLGETGGTVALRIPNHPLTLEILRETGPMAVSSANAHGQPPATSVAQAQHMLGESVAVYLDDGDAAGGGVASTILDVTALSDAQGTVRVLRKGAVGVDQVTQVLPQATIIE